MNTDGPVLPRRAFTLIEMVITVVLIGILGAIAVIGYRAVQENTGDTATVALLRGAAGNQEAHFLSRGAFVAAAGPTDTAGLAALSTLYDPTRDGAAAGWTWPGTEAGLWSANTPGRVSAATTGSGATAELGLAARDRNGTCHFVVVYAPAAGRALYEDTLTSGTCSGTAALAAAP